MSRAKENATPCRIGATKHEAVVERKTRARVRVSFPNARVSRFSLASLEKREKITPILQIVEERENLNERGKNAVLYFSSRHFFPPVSDFPLHSLSAPGSPRMAKNGAAPKPN